MRALAERPQALAPVPYPIAARRLLRDTLFDAASALLEERAWSEITMADVAVAAGVSRHTLYRTFGSRDEFAQALVIREGDRLLDAVEAAVRAHFDDPQVALAAGLEAFLSRAGEDRLVRALLADHGSTGALPFLTTQAVPVLRWAGGRVVAVIREGWPDLPDADLALLADSLVRLALSHLMAPDGDPRAGAAAIARLIDPVIARMLAEGMSAS